MVWRAARTSPSCALSLIRHTKLLFSDFCLDLNQSAIYCDHKKHNRLIFFFLSLYSVLRCRLYQNMKTTQMQLAACNQAKKKHTVNKMWRGLVQKWQMTTKITEYNNCCLITKKKRSAPFDFLVRSSKNEQDVAKQTKNAIKQLL